MTFRIRRRALAAAVPLTMLALAGCASSGESSEQEGPLTLRIGALGNATDTLNPLTTQGYGDYVAVGHLYGVLVRLVDGVATNDLAESIEPDETAGRWTITLREGLTFSDGSPITSTDVAYSLGLLADPETSTSYAGFFADVQADTIEVADDRTLVVPLARPRGDFVTTVLAFASFVLQEGAAENWQTPVSSGAYTLDEYAPGERITLDARDDLGANNPEIKRLEVLIINDPQARMTALQSGELDVATRIDPVMAQTIEANDALEVFRGGEGDSQALGFEMNVEHAPFDNPDVRLAMRLAVDRQALVDTILLGEGFVGNDLIGQGLAGYDTSIGQREHDPERAATLFAEAGVSELTIRASEIAPGLIDATSLLVEQLAEVGVTASIVESDPATFFSDFDVLLSTPMQTMYYINRDAAAFIGSFTGSAGYFNLSAFNPTGYDESVAAAQSIVEQSDREAAFGEIQQQLWRDGGTILWGFQPVLNGQIAGLKGVTLSQGVPDYSRATLTK